MIKNLALAAAAVSSFAVLPAAAEARHGYGYHQPAYSQGYYGRSQYRNGYRRCKSGTTGTIIGGAGGALLGREIAGRGNRTTGTILGAAVGALAGRELTRTKRRNC